MCTTLVGSKVQLRRTTAEDADWLAAMLSTPAVAPWWGGTHDRQWVLDELIDFAAEPSFLVLHGSEPAGLVVYGEVTEADYRSANLDIALHPDFQGRGIGSDALRTLARYCFDQLDHHRLTIDPALENVTAIRCYERVGFKPVGVMRQYQRNPRGGHRDGLLMDMLKGELT